MAVKLRGLKANKDPECSQYNTCKTFNPSRLQTVLVANLSRNCFGHHHLCLPLGNIIKRTAHVIRSVFPGRVFHSIKLFCGSHCQPILRNLVIGWDQSEGLTTTVTARLHATVSHQSVTLVKGNGLMSVITVRKSPVRKNETAVPNQKQWN